MRVDGSDVRRISDGRGKTTCGWFFPGDKRLFFASTTAHDSACPPSPIRRKDTCGRSTGTTSNVNRDGSDLARLTHYDVYTAEGVLSPDGRRIVFTSLKDGDLEIYTMNTDGSDVRRLTTTPGYDGGAWWSPDGKQIVYRANHPTDSTELAAIVSCCAATGSAGKVELYMMNADGSNQRR